MRWRKAGIHPPIWVYPGEPGGKGIWKSRSDSFCPAVTSRQTTDNTYAREAFDHCTVYSSVVFPWGRDCVSHVTALVLYMQGSIATPYVTYSRGAKAGTSTSVFHLGSYQLWHRTCYLISLKLLYHLNNGNNTVFCTGLMWGWNKLVAQIKD